MLEGLILRTLLWGSLGLILSTRKSRVRYWGWALLGIVILDVLLSMLILVVLR